MLNESTATDNMLFLHLVLDECLTSAVFETIETVICQCLAAKTVANLIQMVLARHESEFGEELVRKFYSYLNTSRCGLSEVELQQLLGTPSSKQ